MADDASSRILGIYWGKKSLYLAESTELESNISLSIPFSAREDGSEFSPFSSEGNDLVTSVSSIIKQHSIKPKHIYLSLPTKDIIFRSFVIPWMQQSEIADVVDFEASKYIPFSLEELAYSFHSMNITEGNTKRIRIVFAAIKKTTLDTYTALLEQAKVSITNVEPSPVSMIRCLIGKQLLDQEKTLAIIEKDGLQGKIIIVDRGVPLFVREFQFQISAADKDEPLDNNTILTRLINEIRISLDYFNRQESQLEVTELTLLADATEEQEVKTRIESDIQIPTKSISIADTLGMTDTTTIEYLNAFGASFHTSIDTPSSFDLMETTSEQAETPTFDIKNIDFKSINYTPIAITAAVCIAILGGLFVFKNIMLNDTQKKIATLENELGKFKSQTEDIIKKRTKSTKEKLERYKSVRITGDIATLMRKIPETLPANAWLSELNCLYVEKRPQSKKSKKGKDKNKDAPEYPLGIKLDGYVYSKNPTSNINVVTQFVRNLEKVDLITKNFEKIRVDSAAQRQINNNIVTHFQLDFVTK